MVLSVYNLRTREAETGGSIPRCRCPASLMDRTMCMCPYYAQLERLRPEHSVVPSINGSMLWVIAAKQANGIHADQASLWEPGGRGSQKNVSHPLSPRSTRL